MSFRYKVILLILLASITRFVGLDWGQGNYFHPDENNMATAITKLNPNNLNPEFFAYGQFPLYLGFFTLKTLGVDNNFPNSILILRFYSAIFSLLSLYFFYKIYPNLIFILLLIFSPSLIQLAHFGTTESLLILTFATNLYIAKLIIKNPSIKLFFLASLCTGIAISTKISGAIFILPIVFSAIISRSWYLIPYGTLTLVLSLLLSPYNLIAFSDFLSALKYETSVATGTLPVFYTAQFRNSIPYVFQIKNIFPYISGWPVFIFGLLSIYFIKIKNKKYVFVVLLSCFIYFLYFGQLYVKWTRFMSPLFFVFPLLATLFLVRFPKWTILSILPGVMFFLQYLFIDTRVTASKYLIETIPKGSNVLSESGNVANIPVLPNNLKVNNYDFYEYNPTTLAEALLESEYIVVPSRRVFKNYSFNYYQNLFSGNLGFEEIKTITPISDFLLNPENAEETWSVFDRPTIRIYKKNNQLSFHQYKSLLE
ncbi:MAG TPA: glycosyltransferase family 39 protein [Candidatus Methanoperedens sp.]|nr:glycosyltransferase family 39 protein [Candidatus Methanoperedens sp.]